MRIIKPLTNIKDMLIMIRYYLSKTRSYDYKKGRTYGRISFRDEEYKILPRDFDECEEIKKEILSVNDI